MPSRPRVRAGFSLFLFALLALPQFASAAANHVVISEFATRGPTAATDEFVELYNPTSAPINIAGWHFQYKPATSSTWSDRAILPANTAIGPHGFFLIANQSYIGSVTPDYQSSAWGSGTGTSGSSTHRPTSSTRSASAPATIPRVARTLPTTARRPTTTASSARRSRRPPRTRSRPEVPTRCSATARTPTSTAATSSPRRTAATRRTRGARPSRRSRRAATAPAAPRSARTWCSRMTPSAR